MTTVNTTVDKTSNTSMPIAPGWPYNSYFWVGTVEYRNTTGTNRTPFPARIKKYLPYFTKPLLKTVWEKPPKYTREQMRAFRKLRMTPPPRTPVKRTVEIRRSQLRYKMVWVDNPRVISDVDHPYSGTRYSTKSTAGCCTWNNGAWYNWGSAKTLNLNTVTDPWDPSGDQLALLGKLRDAIAGSDFNAGVAIAEAPRALSMIAENATKIYRAYRSVRKGDPVSAAKELLGTTDNLKGLKLKSKREAAAENWLQLQYGWKPLLQDIHGAAVMLDHRSRNPDVKTVRVSRNAGGRHRSNPLVAYVQWPQNKVRLPVRVTSRSQIVARLKSVDNVRLTGLLDPASVAWELLPYSFVIDWFIPIGNWLSAKELEKSVTGTFVTTHTFRYESYGQKAKSNSGYNLSPYHDGSKCYVKRTVISRTVSTSLSIPRPNFKPLAKVASWAHAANAVALLVTKNRAKFAQGT